MRSLVIMLLFQVSAIAALLRSLGSFGSGPRTVQDACGSLRRIAAQGHSGWKCPVATAMSVANGPSGCRFQ